MATQFTAIYNRFLAKITDDMYMELTPEDTLKDLQRLLIDALPGFEYPRKNLYDYEIKVDVMKEQDTSIEDFIIGVIWADIADDIGNNDKPTEVLVERSSFAEDLTPEEMEILAILMMNGWLQRQVTSIENTRMKYSGADFKMTSQANHLSKLQTLLGECQRQSHHMQRLYKRREINDEGRYQSTWYWFGDCSATK